MQVGDLIAHKSHGVIGIIVKEVQSRISPFESDRLAGLFSIVWFDGFGHIATNHWCHELEKVSS